MATDPTNTSIIDHILVEEGGATVTNDPADAGGKTQYGISERSNPQAWLDGKVTETEARAIYEAKYLVGPGWDKIPDVNLRSLLVDWSVTSGPQLVVGEVQQALGLPLDHVLGPLTLEAILKQDPRTLTNLLSVRRILMIGRIVQRDSTQSRFVAGWLARTCQWVK